MNEQLIKLAEKLNKGVDQIPAIYESLRGQYVTYSICSSISFMAFLFFGATITIAGFAYYAIKADNLSDEFQPLAKRILKICLTVGISSLIIAAVCQVIIYIYAIDIIALKQMVGGK